MWSAIALVTSGLALVAFLAAAGVLAYSITVRRKEQLILAAPEAQRADLVRDTLEFFRVNTARLKRDQQFQIAIEQIRARAHRFRITAAMVAFVAALLAGVSTYAIFQPGASAATTGKDRATQITELEVDINALEQRLRLVNANIERKLQDVRTRNEIIRRLQADREQAQRENKMDRVIALQRQIESLTPAAVSYVSAAEQQEQQTLNFELGRKRQLLMELQHKL